MDEAVTASEKAIVKDAQCCEKRLFILFSTLSLLRVVVSFFLPFNTIVKNFVDNSRQLLTNQTTNSILFLLRKNRSAKALV